MLANTVIALGALAAGAAAWEDSGSWNARERLTCSGKESLVNYTTVTGYFLQDDASTSTTGFDYTTTNYGLKNQVYDTDAAFDPEGKKTQWERFTNKVRQLNKAADKNTQYKVLFLARHGEGFHNAAESFYGTPAWNCYWSELDGNGTTTWNDALLTQAGIDQTVKATNFWAAQIRDQKMPIPESFYSSPLTRCTDTLNRTFAPLNLPNFVPVIKEYLREGISMHTCDQRRSKTFIANRYPTWKFEAGFAEEDPYWNAMRAETSDAEDLRNKRLMDDLFSNDPHTWLAVSAHSGEIGSILRVLSHRAFSLSTGQAIPVLVKAYNNRKVEEVEPVVQSWTSQATCTNPPVTSLAAGGYDACICAPTGTFSLASASTSAAASASASAAATTTASSTSSAATSTITAPPRRRVR